jgi:predicted dithiol-disulfide oxidoreductase (DUF899 family)
MSTVENHKIVSRDQWLAARIELFAKEKEITRARDAVSAQRQQLPWVKVEKEYVFDTPSGKKTLAELFDGNSQLIVYHFMWRREWGAGCVGCSFLADHIDGANLHLAQHDVSLVVVSRAPLSALQQVAQGKVYYNHGITESPIEELSGISVFYKDADGDIFHTYSSYARGNEEVLGTYVYLDLTPKGRNETGPNHNLTDWVRHHDRFGAGGFVDATGGYIAPKSETSCCHSTEDVW